jgi:hypothetical protein
MRDNILVKMPDTLEHFLAAAAVVQDYCVQLHKQVGMKRRNADFWFTLEVVDDSYMFLWPIFPRMNFVLPGEVTLSRMDWSCVVDLSGIERVWKVAEVPKKHMVEAWGIMIGASPKTLPVLGAMQPQGQGEIDVLIDERVEAKEQLCEYFDSNHPDLVVKVVGLEGLRVGTMFGILDQAKVCLLHRGGASYLAATMGKPTIELYQNDLPVWWLAKPNCETYKTFYGKQFSAEMIWPVMEDVVMQAIGSQVDYDLITSIQPFEPVLR